MDDSTSFDPAEFYDTFPRIEQEFRTALDQSLHPRGPDMLYDVVGDLGLPAVASVLDVGCGEGRHTLTLAERFGFVVRGIDPVSRHVELANQALATAAAERPEMRGRVSFAFGMAGALPIDDASVDLIWCRDVLVHVPDLDKAYAEFRRVLRSNGRIVIYQMFATDQLEPREARWLFDTMGVVPSSADPPQTVAAIAAAGLRIDDCLELGAEWGEFAEEARTEGSPRLLHAARLLRDPQRYQSKYGQTAYNIMLGDCLWHVYRMIGKLSPRVYLLSAEDTR